MCQIPSYVQCTGCSPFGVQHIAHPTDCSSYYLCVSGIRTLQKCKDNLLFDKSIGDCNAAGSVMCITDYTQICSEFGGYVKIGDPNDCSKYVIRNLVNYIYCISILLQILFLFVWCRLPPRLCTRIVL